MIEKSFLQYLSEVRKFNLLSIEQEETLGKKAHEGDEKAVSELVTANLRLVISIAKKFNFNSASFEDIVQEGNLGLVIAARKFDPAFKIRFASYAYTWIMQMILRYLYSKTALVRLPLRKSVIAVKVRRAVSMFSFLNGRNPTAQEISEFSGIDVSDVEEVLEMPISVCNITENHEASDLNPEEELILKAEKERAWSLMNILPVKERYIIYHHFNFGNEDENESLRNIAKVLNVSAETVRRLEARALNRMRGFAEQEESEKILQTA